MIRKSFLVLCILLCGLIAEEWARTRWVGGVARYVNRISSDRCHFFTIGADGHVVGIEYRRIPQPLYTAATEHGVEFGPGSFSSPDGRTKVTWQKQLIYSVPHYRPKPEGFLGSLGFTLRQQNGPGYNGIQLLCPLWFLLLLAAVYPLFRLIGSSVRRRRRRTNGLCLKCGYNLTGNVSGLCPECGEAISGKTVPQRGGRPLTTEQ